MQYMFKISPFTSKLDLNLRKKLKKCYIWSIALHVLERYGEDQLDRSCDNEEVLRRVKRKGTSYTKQKGRKDRTGEKRRSKA